jgi:hypothetical protein
MLMKIRKIALTALTATALIIGSSTAAMAATLTLSASSGGSTVATAKFSNPSKGTISVYLCDTKADGASAAVKVNGVVKKNSNGTNTCTTVTFGGLQVGKSYTVSAGTQDLSAGTAYKQGQSGTFKA